MAYFEKRSGSWRATVYKGGRQSKTFKRKADAEHWAAQIESDIDAIRLGRTPSKTLREALIKYKEDVSPSKGGERWEAIRLNKWADLKLAQKVMSDVTTTDMAQWRDNRLKEVSPATVLRELNLWGAVFTRARREWKWIKENPLSDLEKPKGSVPRKQRISDQVERTLQTALGGHTGDSKSSEVAIAFSLCIETAMRLGECLALTWGNISGRVAHIPKSKNGDARDVPLSKRALELLEIMRGKDEEKVFTVTGRTADVLFRRARDKVGLSHIHFHDTRREALTRLSKKLDVLTLAKISGHHDLKILLKVYYSPNMDEIADKL